MLTTHKNRYGVFSAMEFGSLLMHMYPNIQELIMGACCCYANYDRSYMIYELEKKLATGEQWVVEIRRYTPKTMLASENEQQTAHQKQRGANTCILFAYATIFDLLYGLEFMEHLRQQTRT